MGAQQFATRGTGKTVAEAFATARERAAWEHGHGGYSGSLAEKGDYAVITLPKGVDVEKFVRAVQQFSPNDKPEPFTTAEMQSAWLNAYEKTDDKWGPAGAIQVAPEEWIFFGWASS